MSTWHLQLEAYSDLVNATSRSHSLGSLRTQGFSS